MTEQHGGEHGGAPPEATAVAPLGAEDPVEVEFAAEQRHYEQAWQQLWPWEKRVARMLLPALGCLAVVVLESRQRSYGAGLAVGVAACALGMMADLVRQRRAEPAQSWRAHFDRPMRYRYRFDPEGLAVTTATGTRHYAWRDLTDVRSGAEIVTFTPRTPVVIWAPVSELTTDEWGRIEAWWRAAREGVRPAESAEAPSRTWWRGGRRSTLVGLACFLVPVVAALLAAPAWAWYERHRVAFPCGLLTDGEIEDAVGLAPLSHRVAPDPFARLPGAGTSGPADACFWVLPQGDADVPSLVSVRAVRDGAAYYGQNIEPLAGATPVEAGAGLTGSRMEDAEGQMLAVLRGDRLVVMTVVGQGTDDGALLDLARRALARLD